LFNGITFLNISNS